MADLKQSISDGNVANKKLDSENRDLKENLANMTETCSKQKETLKAKTTELCKARMSEGRLTIEVNKLKSDISTFNGKFEACVVKFNKEINATTTENENLRVISGHYERIKKSFEKVTKRDEEFCGVNLKSESFSSLTDDELCEMIELFIEDSFESQLERCVGFEQTSIAMKRLKSTTGTTIDKKNALIKQLTNKLDTSCKTYQSTKAENKSLKLRERNLVGKVASMEKIIESLKNELALESSRGQKMVTDLKMEVFELDKVATWMKEENDKQLANGKDLENKIADMTKTLAENALAIGRHRADSDGKSRLIDALKSEVSELADIVVNLQEKTNTFLAREIDGVTKMAKLRQDLKDCEEKVEALTKANEAMRKQHLEELKNPSGLEKELEEYRKRGLELQSNNERLKRQNKDLEDSMTQQNAKIKEIEAELRAAKKSNVELKSKVQSDKPEMKALQYELREKEKLIKTLQKNNDNVDADLSQALKEKTSLEFTMNQLSRDLKMKEADYFEALKKHSENLNAMKAEVIFGWQKVEGVF